MYEAEGADDFCQAWLALQCSLIHGIEYAVVALGEIETGPFKPVTFWPRRGAGIFLAELAEKSLDARHGIILKPDNKQQAHFGIAFPIIVEGDLHGTVAMQIKACSDEQVQSALRQLQWGASWLDSFLRHSLSLSEAGLRENMISCIDHLATLLEHDGYKDSIRALVTELAVRLDCDRVSLGAVYSDDVKILVLSHSAQFGKKMDLIRMLSEAMEEVVDYRKMIQIPFVDDGKYHVVKHAELARRFGSEAVLSIPLWRKGEVYGVLTLERPKKSFQQSEIELCESLALLATPIIEMKRDYERSIFVKAALSLRDQLEKLLGPEHMKRKLLLGTGIFTVLFFMFATGDFRVSADGRLEGSIQRSIVAPFDGYLADSLVKAGDTVKQGDLLCSLDDKELFLEKIKWGSQRGQYLRQYQDATASHKRAQSVIVQAQVDQADAELQLVNEKIKRAKITSPLTGLVVSGDLSQRLGGSVQRGELLFEIAPLDQYRLILEVDEHDIDFIQLGQQGTLRLAALPNEMFLFHVKLISSVTTSENKKNFFRVEANLTNNPSPHLRPGMKGVGKIVIGERNLFWTWSRESVNWLRLWFWSWWP